MTEDEIDEIINRAAARDGEFYDGTRAKTIRFALAAKGLVIVSVEPTLEQNEAGHKALSWHNKLVEREQVQRRSVCDTIYRAMIGSRV